MIMARLTKEAIEAKIKAAEEKVVKTGKTYNATPLDRSSAHAP